MQLHANSNVDERFKAGAMEKYIYMKILDKTLYLHVY